MSSEKTFRPMAIGTALVALVAMASALAPQHIKSSPASGQDAIDTIAMDSQGSFQKSSGLVRRQRQQATYTLSAVEQDDNDDKVRQPDPYVLIGRNKCDGGGQWKHYEMNSVTPGKYTVCSAACDAKDECIGFDVGDTGCNLYTQRPVAIGTWEGVKFDNGGAFVGMGAHDAYPTKPMDLTLGTTPLDANMLFMCYRKTFYKPVESYYWLIGNGTCSGGGLWKRYKRSPADWQSCSRACDQRDECVGFDFGLWTVTQQTVQTYQTQFTTTRVTTPGCFMYAQKPVFGTWPSVQDINPESGEGDHDDYPKTPFELKAGFKAEFQAGDETGQPSQCFGKTHWVNLEQYYMELGTDRCTGGGQWKYYKMSMIDGVPVTLQDCKSKCDEKDSCVGVDFKDNEECRLYSRVAVPPDTWPNVHFAAASADEASTSISNMTAGAYPGDGDHNKFPPTPFSLSVNPTGTGAKCLAKTHFESPDQVLGDNDIR